MKLDTIAKFKFNTLAEFMQGAQDAIRFSGIDPALVHIEPQVAYPQAILTTCAVRATLVEETLTDNSKVYTLRLS